MGVYQIQIYAEIDETTAKRITEKIRYRAEKAGLAWFVAYSRTDSRTAQQRTIRTGKPGRPKKFVTGRIVPGHIHAVITGDHAHAAAHAIRDAINEILGGLYCRPVSISSPEHLQNFLTYSARQANFTRQGGPKELFWKNYSKAAGADTA